MSRSRSSQSKGGLTVEIGDTSVDLDITICKLLVKTTQRLSKCVPVVPQKTSSSAHAPTLGLPDVSVAKVEISFCGCVPRRPPARLPFQPLEEMLPPDQALLKLSLSPVSFVTDRMTKQCLTVSKILMTHGTRQVLSCLDDVNVRDSLSSSSMLRPHDFVATLIGNRHEIQMKPIHMVLDLLVIDDVLSRSGGLDALLDLGTSMMSTNTVKGQSSPPVIETSRQRAVRFSEPHKPARAESGPMSTSPKVDIRVSGTVLDLIGSESSIQIKTSVIKAVYRENNLRVVVDGAALEGPLLNDSESRGEVNAKIRNIELYYSDVPSDNDLDRLLSLITPSSNSYGEDDDIMVDTLIRQRRRGGVLRLHVADLKAEATGFAWVPHVSKVSDEISRLSYVAKLLPEDDRPGVLIFGLFKKLDARFEVDPGFGSLRLRADLLEGAHISVPSLAAAQVASWNLSRSDTDILIREVTAENSAAMAPPMLMCRFIADEMEPTVKVKLSNTCIEYKVPTVTSVTSLLERLKDKGTSPGRPSSQQSSSESSPSIDAAAMARKIKFSLAFKDCAIALNPDNSVARGLFVLTDATIRHEHQSYGSLENLDIKKASLLIINDEKAVGQSLSNADTKLYFEENDQVQQLTKAGFVPVGSMSSASAVIMVIEDKANKETRIDVEFRNNLLFLETCADSTHILMQILGGLAPPPKPSKYPKYRTEIVPIEDMLASFTGDAFVAEQGPEHGLQASQHADPQGSGSQLQKYDDDNDDDEEEEGLLGDLYQDDADDEMTASYADSHIGQSTLSESVHVGPAGTSDFGDSGSDQSVMASSSLDFRTNHFAPKISVGGTAHRWNTAQDTYSLSADHILQRSPLTVRIRDVHVIWNLFDGYDWQTTRDTIAQTVKDIETKALARRPRSSRRAGGANEDDDESVIGDFLFNSIYIGIPANKDPRELTSAINHDIDDMVSDTSSYATGSTVTAATSRRQSAPAPRQKRLKLNRSRHHKMAFELEGISADFVVFPPGHGEVESSSDIRVKKIEVFDHVPTSTWKKFATYMQDAGEREMDTNMVHVEMLNVRPVADLSATELVLKIGILPLRLHVDQDALDFLTRFFEFKDESTTSSGPPSEPVFLQRVDIGPIPLRLDFKPKRVDYGGLRSGRTTEFMNFVVLDRSDMVLKRVISYGVPGFERLGNTLNNIWTADVKQTQLPGVLAGLAPLRPLVDVTRGVRDLVAVPIREYRKDGRLVRSIQKGAVAFAKTTTTELVNLGAKMAIGSQKVIQDTLDTVEQREERHIGDPDEEARQISLYADQPLGIMQGLRGAYQSLERDLLLAKDAILAVPGEVVASGSAKGAAAAVVKQSPTIILRPALGAAKAIGQTLLGAGNTLDKQNLRRMDEVCHIVHYVLILLTTLQKYKRN
jgi:autophagy-related protein 2